MTNSPTIVASPYTGDYRIDTLLAGLQYRWNAGAPLASPVTVTYSFMTAAPAYGGNVDDMGDSGFSTFTPQQRSAVREIMAKLEAELGIHLVEVGDSAFGYGQIRFGNNTQTISAGYAWLPYSTGDERAGDVWIDDSEAANLVQVVPGTDAYETLVHEIGHALGLKHPGNYNAGSSNPEFGNYLGTAEDNTNFTIMSYTPPQGGQPRDWYGMYDLLALKALYGADSSFNAGATTYAFQDSDGRVLKIIDDASGFDTIDLSGLTLGATIDLHPGAFSSIGRNGFSAATNNLSIDFGTTIERVIGTAFADHAVGNDINNQFTMSTGTNFVDGGAGLDTEMYSLARANYQVSLSGTLAAVNGGGASDTLFSVERLVFSDRGVALDISGNAGMTAKTIGAVFGASWVTSHPDYVSAGLHWLDAGTSYSDLLQLAINARLGAGASSVAVVTLLYTNVAGTPPPADELALFKGWLDTGVYTQGALGMFAAETPKNIANIDLAGLAAHGLEFV
jgi:serralysin